MTNDEQKPYAWAYEIAYHYDKTNGKYGDFRPCLSVPQPALGYPGIRNARPLYLRSGSNAATPQPTHYTISEGGSWIPWGNHNQKTAHAIKFDNGMIFDMVNGWRVKSEHVPEMAYLNKHDNQLHSRYTDDLMAPEFRAKWDHRKEEFSDIPYPTKKGEINLNKLRKDQSDDYRFVARGLLEHCLSTFTDFDCAVSLLSETLKSDIQHSIAQLKAALAIEKKELKAPWPKPEPCGSWHSMSLNGPCTNCGHPSSAHE